MPRCAKNLVKTMFFGTFSVSNKIWFRGALGGFGTSFWELFGHPGRQFGGLEGLWKEVEILMNFGTPTGSPEIPSTGSLHGDLMLGGVQ